LRIEGGRTPFLLCCLANKLPVMKLLLKDPRVDVVLADDEGCTPVWTVIRWSTVEVMEWMLASGRELGNLDVGYWENQARVGYSLHTEQQREVGRLLTRFLYDPLQRCYELRVKLGMVDELAAEIFALVVFLCDPKLRENMKKNEKE